jgi:hypothetical protein
MCLRLQHQRDDRGQGQAILSRNHPRPTAAGPATRAVRVRHLHSGSVSIRLRGRPRYEELADTRWTRPRLAAAGELIVTALSAADVEIAYALRSLRAGPAHCAVLPEVVTTAGRRGAQFSIAGRTSSRSWATSRLRARPIVDL